METFDHNGQSMSYVSFGDGDTAFVWAHGWGQNHRSLWDTAQALGFMGKHYLLDLPGFGASPKPSTDWRLDDYAACADAFIAALPQRTVIWVGHSFGCRVGIKLATRKPAALGRLVLIAAAGLPRKRSPLMALRFYLQIRLFKILKHLAPTDALRNKLRTFFGSADYNSAGAMRQIFIHTIHENLQDAAAHVDVPALLIYGSQDGETPPEIGQRLVKLMPTAQLRVLDGFDHYTILTSGRHQVARLIKNFVSTGT